MRGGGGESRCAERRVVGSWGLARIERRIGSSREDEGRCGGKGSWGKGQGHFGGLDS